VITKLELGGAQLSTINLISNLPNDKYQLSIITSHKGQLKQELKGLKNVSVYFSPFLTRPINPILDILAFAHIYKIYMSNRFKIVHTHSSKAGIIGRWAGVLYNINQRWFQVTGSRLQVVHTVHGWSFNNYQCAVKKWLFIYLEKITAIFTSKIICVSKRDIETALRYRIAPRGKIALIKYGIQLHQFKNSTCDTKKKKRELGINNNDTVIGMISCLKPQKSPLDYVRACIGVYNKRKDVNFLLVGDGVLRKACESEISRSSINGRFVFTGWRMDISDILDIIDIAVLTSRWEGLPIAIIEALSKGKPVVATDAGGSRELVKEGVTGYITRPGRYQDITDRVLGILADKDLFSKMRSEAAGSIDDSFDVKAMAENIENLYRSLSS